MQELSGEGWFEFVYIYIYAYRKLGNRPDESTDILDYPNTPAVNIMFLHYVKALFSY